MTATRQAATPRRRHQRLPLPFGFACIVPGLLTKRQVAEMVPGPATGALLDFRLIGTSRGLERPRAWTKVQWSTARVATRVRTGNPMPGTSRECTWGASAPLGATVSAHGVNFSVFARHATAVELVFFDRAEDPRPARAIPLDPVANRTYHYWHGFVPGLRAAGAMKSVVVDPGAYDW